MTRGHTKSSAGKSPFLYVEKGIGYQFAPHAEVTLYDEDGRSYNESLNNEGWRGEDYSLEPSHNVYRVLVIGDSVAESFSVRRHESWPHLVQQHLNDVLRKAGNTLRTEVLNAGMGGYVSWQIGSRLRSRGLSYHPDCVLVLAGWNDIVLGSRADWTPRIDLSQINASYGKRHALVPLLLKKLCYDTPFIGRFTRKARAIAHQKTRDRLILEHSDPSNVPFNSKALKIFADEIQCMAAACRDSDCACGFVICPCLVCPANQDDARVLQKLINYFYHSPLSSLEFLSWHKTFAEQQRRIASELTEAFIVDGDLEFAGICPQSRYDLFTDLVHLTRSGNLRLARIVGAALEPLVLGRRPR